MRRALLLVVCQALWLPAVATAQATDSEAATVTATVIRSLSLAKLSAGSLNFGRSPQGTTDQINPKTPNAAQFRATGQVSTAVDVSFPATVTLNNGGSSLTFTSNLTGNTINNRAVSSGLSSGADVVLHTTTGEYYLWVGGSIAVPVNAAVGVYSGTFTLTLAYTGT